MEMVASGATSARQMQQFIEANLHHRHGKWFSIGASTPIGHFIYWEWQRERGGLSSESSSFDILRSHVHLGIYVELFFDMNNFFVNDSIDFGN